MTDKLEITEGVNLQFKISNDLSTTIRMMQLNLQAKGTKMKLEDIYPECLELGIAGFKKKYGIA